MARENHSLIVTILDRSGSMESIKSDAIGGFNSFIESQKQIEGTADSTLVLFDDQYELLFDTIPLDKVRNLTSKTFVPRGSTALFDAIGKTIDDIGEKQARLEEFDRPSKVIIAILTDGEENSSEEYSQKQIKRMIKHQSEKYAWEFLFIAANQDAFSSAESIGISRDSAVQFDCDREGVAEVFSSMAERVCEMRAPRSRRKANA